MAPRKKQQKVPPPAEDADNPTPGPGNRPSKSFIPLDTWFDSLDTEPVYEEVYVGYSKEGSRYGGKWIVMLNNPETNTFNAYYCTGSPYSDNYYEKIILRNGKFGPSSRRFVRKDIVGHMDPERVSLFEGIFAKIPACSNQVFTYKFVNELLEAKIIEQTVVPDRVLTAAEHDVLDNELNPQGHETNDGKVVRAFDVYSHGTWYRHGVNGTDEAGTTKGEPEPTTVPDTENSRTIPALNPIGTVRRTRGSRDTMVNINGRNVSIPMDELSKLVEKDIASADLLNAILSPPNNSQENTSNAMTNVAPNGFPNGVPQAAPHAVPHAIPQTVPQAARHTAQAARQAVPPAVHHTVPRAFPNNTTPAPTNRASPRNAFNPTSSNANSGFHPTNSTIPTTIDRNGNVQPNAFAVAAASGLHPATSTNHYTNTTTTQQPHTNPAGNTQFGTQQGNIPTTTVPTPSPVRLSPRRSPNPNRIVRPSSSPTTGLGITSGLPRARSRLNPERDTSLSSIVNGMTPANANVTTPASTTTSTGFRPIPRSTPAPAPAPATAPAVASTTTSTGFRPIPCSTPAPAPAPGTAPGPASTTTSTGFRPIPRHTPIGYRRPAVAPIREEPDPNPTRPTGPAFRGFPRQTGVTNRREEPHPQPAGPAASGSRTLPPTGQPSAFTREVTGNELVVASASGSGTRPRTGNRHAPRRVAIVEEVEDDLDDEMYFDDDEEEEEEVVEEVAYDVPKRFPRARPAAAAGAGAAEGGDLNSYRARMARYGYQ
ncbi:hypothetical protein BJY04DRAFT_223826 [Aspergillus karnatakaensis]|uniref:uncharacterized protein n=1 Tax=Aspergillus karnatakaensis TaxID=1810916 RepID=UPI003CCDC7D0